MDQHAVHRPPHARRILGYPPRTSTLRRTPPHRGEAGNDGPAPAAAPAASQPAQRVLREWHDMTPGEQAVAWAQLRQWVIWLHDRYELSTEERLPRCWTRHPGLVEELWALRAWRLEIYSSGQPSTAQQARYWHSELRQVLHAAATMYAAGCRAGHRGAPALAVEEPGLRRRWAESSPLAGVPGTETAAGRARRADLGGWASAEAMAAALDSGDAVTVPGLEDYVRCAGMWWIPAADGWIQVPPPPGEDGQDAKQADPWAEEPNWRGSEPWRT